MNKLKFVLKYCKVWLIVSLAVIIVFFTATMVATQNDFLSGTIDTVLGGEGRRNTSGNPNDYYRYTKTTDEFKQFETDLELSQNVISSRADKEAVHAAANKLNEEIVGEGVVLLKNQNNALPITTSAQDKARISVFGKNSADIVLGGSGSGGGNSIGSTSLYDGLRNANFELNPTLVDSYQSNRSGEGRADSPAIGATVTGLAIGETPLNMYSADIRESYSQYNDAAIIVISRLGGEGWDLPRRQLNPDGTPVEGSKDGGQHYLELDKNEEALIDDVINCGKFDKVILLINCATSFELGFLEEKEGLDAALWIGTTGGSGTNAVGNVLNGTINPSGHLVDTYVRDFTKDPTWNNFGDNLGAGNTYTQGGAATDYHYVEYEEGIYLGYRYYETRSYQEWYRFGTDNGWYDENVVFPFGYGLSYTTFDWTLKEAESTSTQIPLDKDSNNKITVTVTVHNTGKVAGKDVVQLYYSAPYITNGIEKAHVVLGGMVKTDLLQPDESKDYTVTLDIEDMASYDYSDANGNGNIGYELDAGTYTIYIGRDAHSCWSSDNPMSLEYTVMEDIVYPMDIYGTQSNNDNRFQDMSDYMQGKTMSRSGFNATFPQAPTSAEREMSETVNNSLTYKYDDAEGNYVDYILSTQVTPAEGEVPQLYDLIGVDYDDPRWQTLVNSLSTEELAMLIGQGNFHTESIERINKPRTIDPDGPAGFTNFMGDPTVHDTCFYASECIIGATWNVDLANDMGVMVGLESLVGYTNGDGRTYSGWYAPAVNIHRSPFSGRNWEYYSEDPFLSGIMGTKVVIGAQSKGVYTFVKHFVLNDQETNRDSYGLITWADEQTFREIYLKPFQMIVEDGNTHGMMSSFNRIGTTWAGGSFALLTEVLRMEWGFKGMVITDYNLSIAYMPPEQMIRAGGDLNLSQDYKPATTVDESTGMTNEVQLAAMRNAAKNILYTVANSNAMNGMGEGVVWVTTMAWWKVMLICINVGLVVAAAVWGFFDIRHKLKKAKLQEQDKA